jgi:hypothetical protein
VRFSLNPCTFALKYSFSWSVENQPFRNKRGLINLETRSHKRDTVFSDLLEGTRDTLWEKYYRKIGVPFGFRCCYAEIVAEPQAPPLISDLLPTQDELLSMLCTWIPAHVAVRAISTH